MILVAPIRANIRSMMVITKNIVILSLALIVSALIVTPAYAHVIIRDDASKVGAVLHVTPDDDPVAGEHSDLFFSLENQSLDGSVVSISITNTETNETDVPDVSRTSSGIVA